MKKSLPLPMKTPRKRCYTVFRGIFTTQRHPAGERQFHQRPEPFQLSAKVLRELLNEESYICVGRAADFVLKDKPNVLTVYIDAPYEDRIEREMKRQGIGRSQAIHYIDKLDTIGKVTISIIRAASGSVWKITTSAWTASRLGWITAWRSSRKLLN